jgi:GNAT superfamily N-acetyltransferase
MNFSVRRLEGGDLLDGFDAGPDEDEKTLTAYFRQRARQNQKRKLSATWVAIDGIVIAGFVTTCPGSAAPAPLKSHGLNLPHHPAPVLVLARMATSARHRGMGVGRLLLDMAVMSRAKHLAEEHGCCGVITDAKTKAVAFYAKHGFSELAGDAPTGNTLTMFRPLR